mmetsp:Transcript_6035/g.14658  ORF Transcript_6035/g.14658 Transcript_6035/m.14658 type:complete len:235 (-) Transcript_6035:2803-3507(-)
MHNISANDVVITSQAVQLNFCYSCTICKVQRRMAFILGPIPAFHWRRVIAVRTQIDHVENSSTAYLCKSCTLHLCAERGKSGINLLARIEHSTSVQVCPNTSSCRRSVGASISRSFEYVHVGKVNAKLFCCDRCHLGVESLAHLNTAMTDQNRAISKAVDECGGFVQKFGGEAKAVLGRNNGDAPLFVFVFCIEIFDCLASAFHIGRACDLVPNIRKVALCEASSKGVFITVLE